VLAGGASTGGAGVAVLSVIVSSGVVGRAAVAASDRVSDRIDSRGVDDVGDENRTGGRRPV